MQHAAETRCQRTAARWHGALSWNVVQVVVLLLLAGFLTRAVAWDIEARVVDHTIEHATGAHVHGSHADTGIADDGHSPEPASEGIAHDESVPAAHDLLHALAGLQLVNGPMKIALPVVATIASEFPATLRPPASWDASVPFRPPRRR